MPIDATWYQISNAASGVLFIVLGLLVGSLGTRGRANRAFALFGISFGTAMVVLNLFMGGAPTRPETSADAAFMLLASIMWLAAAAGLVALALVVHRIPIRHSAWDAGLAASFGLLYWLGVWVGSIAEGRLGEPVLMSAVLSLGLLLGVMWAISLFFALRFLRASEGEAAGYALMSAALAIYPAFWGGIQFALRVQSGSAGLATAFLAIAMPVLVLAVTWLIVGARCSGSRARIAHRVAWVCLGAALAGAIAAPFAEGSEHWGYGASRVLSVGLLAFAIVRGQAAGIDLKLRQGVSQSTVAAVFIAVFFAASEVAQEFFGETTGSTYLGIAAAGALVFAIVPLQRAAERLADRAVPVASAAADVRSASKTDLEDAYRKALRLALRSGGFNRDDQVAIAELAEALGIGAGRAAAITRDVERELEARA